MTCFPVIVIACWFKSLISIFSKILAPQIATTSVTSSKATLGINVPLFGSEISSIAEGSATAPVAFMPTFCARSILTSIKENKTEIFRNSKVQY